MKTRAVLMMLAALVLAAAGVIILTTSSHLQADVATSSTTSVTASASAAAPPPSLPPPAPTPDVSDASGPQQTPPAYEAPQLSDEQLQAYLDEADPSTVPDPLRGELVALASDVLDADLTGQGREKWPSYFDAQPATKIWSDVHHRAAVVKWGKGGELVAEVTLLWSATDSLGVRHEDVASTITLVRVASGWSPKKG